MPNPSPAFWWAVPCQLYQDWCSWQSVAYDVSYCSTNALLRFFLSAFQSNWINPTHPTRVHVCRSPTVYQSVYIYITCTVACVHVTVCAYCVCVSRLMIRFHTIPLAVTADYCIRRQIPALHDYKQYVFTQAFVRTQCLQSVMQGLCPSCQSWPWPRTLDPFWLEGCYRPVSMSFVKMWDQYICNNKWSRKM